jgi:hypothetical protein
MLLHIELAGHAGYWRFPGTVGFAQWLADCPWFEQGGACVLHLPGRSDGRAFADAVERAVHGWDRGVSGARVELMDGGALRGDLRASVARHVGIPAEAATWQVREALARLLAERPTVIVVMPPAPDCAIDLWQEAAALRDEMSKTDFAPPLTWIVLDNALARTDSRVAFDYTRGQPVFGVFDTARSAPAALWSAYVHARLAWEAGGDPAVAEQLFAALQPALGLGADEALEQGLNAWSRNALDDIQKPERDALECCLRGSPERVDGLVDRGLLWRPPGSRAPLPTPWVARALLAASPDHPRAWLLRGVLVCVPLANELLARCQELEHQIKSNSVADAATVRPPPEEVQRLWQRYRAGQDETTRYPPGHPAPPTGIADAWLFASLGQFLREPGSPLGRRGTHSEHSLSRLRNTLAHGHYVCWSHVRAMQRILEVPAP